MRMGLPGMLRLEARRSVGFLLFPVVALTVWILSDQGRAQGIWLWPDVSLSIQSTVALVAPLAGGIAAWTASRDSRRGMEELLATTPRPRASRDLVSWLATVTWFGLAYVLAAVCVNVFAYLDYAWGWPVIWPMVTGLFAIVAHISLGYAAGVYVPSVFTAPSVAVGLFLLQVAPVYFTGSTHHLAPLGESLTRSVFYGVLPNLFVGQSLWLLGLAGVGLSAVLIRQKRSLASVSLLLATLGIAITGAVSLLNEPAWANPKQMEAATIPYEPVCEYRGITVCVHPAYRTLLPEAAGIVGSVAKPLVGVPRAPDRAEQAGSIFAAPESRETVTFFLYDNSSMGDELASQVAGELVGLQGSASVVGTEGTEGAQVAIQAWLLRQAGRNSEYVVFSGEEPEAIAAASERFAELDSAKRNGWLRQNYGDLRAGKLTLTELP